MDKLRPRYFRISFIFLLGSFKVINQLKTLTFKHLNKLKALKA
jgi:hypothetical protein